MGHFRGQQVTKDGFSWGQTTSLNGSRPSPWQTLETLIPRSLCGRTSSLDSEYHIHISDNGVQFDSKAFRKYCGDMGIINRYSTPAYPQGNGQAEAVNKVIVSGLKKRLDDAKGRWVEELPHVLWTYRTMPRRSIGETPFSMTYGAEAVIPLESGFPMILKKYFKKHKKVVFVILKIY